jgi:hypothetical protein
LSFPSLGLELGMIELLNECALETTLASHLAKS